MGTLPNYKADIILVRFSFRESTLLFVYFLNKFVQDGTQMT